MNASQTGGGEDAGLIQLLSETRSVSACQACRMGFYGVGSCQMYRPRATSSHTELQNVGGGPHECMFGTVAPLSQT